MADVFVSYKREDAAKVRKLVAALRAAGLDTWWDEDIDPAAPWEATIEKELCDARAVIVCWSPHSVESDNVRSEARTARDDGRLIQVFLTSCKPPLFFGERQGIDLTGWRGRASDPRIAKVVESVRPVASCERRADETRTARRWLDGRMSAALGLILLVGIGLSAWLVTRRSRPEGPMTIAILPFRALNPADASLVDAIWDDTRGAISRNPNLRVLGRQAVEALAKKDLQPADYRAKVGADYLLDGSIQHVGSQVQMKFSLTQTRDGSEIWSDQIGGKLDDIFVFQQQVAREVEGRIRGRVAPGGGIRDRNIATSGEVYAIYADARALVRRRDTESIHAAIPLLRKAVAMDPNYAPAWATLGQARGMVPGRNANEGRLEQQNEAVGYVRRALQLAPNLAHAHAVLAMVQSLPPELDGELEEAVKLDPNDVEAWGWLANSLQQQYRLKEALTARDRAVQIEPLWWWTSVNRIGTLGLLGDRAGINAELARVQALGDPVLLAKAEAQAAWMTYRPGDRIRILLNLRSSHPEELSWVDNMIVGAMVQLGFTDEAVLASKAPPGLALAYHGLAPSPDAIGKETKTPLDLWTNVETMILYARLLPAHGRSKELLGYYDAAFKSPAELFALLQREPALWNVAPSLAAALRAAGRSEEAGSILRHAEAVAIGISPGAPTTESLATLAYLRGAEGRDEEASALLAKAVSQDWLPDGEESAADIADEPCFAQLVQRADFQAARRRILTRMAQERQKVPLDLLRQAYPVRAVKAAA